MLTSSFDARVTGYVCTAVAITILIVRIVTSRLKLGYFDVSVWVCVLAILVASSRIVVNQYVLTYGTSNDAIYGNTKYFDEEDLARLKIGSILALIARLLITTFYWLQNCLLLLFYSQLFQIRSRLTTALIRSCWAALALSYIAVVLSTFLECRPFRLYWQVDPAPGTCIRAYIQLVVQASTNIVLDLHLLAISFPLIIVQHRTLSERLRVWTLFVLGFFCIIITCIRLAYIYAESSYQPVRSLWASIQLLVSCFVANAPTIYGSIKLIKRRKSEQTARRGSRPEIWLHLHVSNENAAAADVPVVTRQISHSPTSCEKAWSRWVP
ncbi:hypothetical protein PV10_07542 [Exophiala mesophila]|uniref:Rhodopsin domain-containing protein n=1 Tax=Exophiala mesophila TaxID=212818 RepID=A0A0D1ZTS8_EXOME|nr:uncharacterized protein PV10_07542 [Exophiala mesophila]KIV90213.1 hypothetical protein PV10_07542 [Exophiala mesophila]